MKRQTKRQPKHVCEYCKRSHDHYGLPLDPARACPWCGYFNPMAGHTQECQEAARILGADCTCGK